MRTRPGFQVRGIRSSPRQSRGLERIPIEFWRQLGTVLRYIF